MQESAELYLSQAVHNSCNCHRKLNEFNDDASTPEGALENTHGNTVFE